MEIQFFKINGNRHSVKIIRDDASTDSIELDTKTYFLHDICHYVVERHVHADQGFWGMLARGYGFDALSGKNNELTPKLRLIEQLVGPVQAVVSGHLSPADFLQAVAHLRNEFKSELPVEVLAETIHAYLDQWNRLPYGKIVKLVF